MKFISLWNCSIIPCCPFRALIILFLAPVRGRGSNPKRPYLNLSLTLRSKFYNLIEFHEFVYARSVQCSKSNFDSAVRKEILPIIQYTLTTYQINKNTHFCQKYNIILLLVVELTAPHFICMSIFIKMYKGVQTEDGVFIQVQDHDQEGGVR